MNFSFVCFCASKLVCFYWAPCYCDCHLITYSWFMEHRRSVTINAFALLKGRCNILQRISSRICNYVVMGVGVSDAFDMCRDIIQSVRHLHYTAVFDWNAKLIVHFVFHAAAVNNFCCIQQQLHKLLLKQLPFFMHQW